MAVESSRPRSKPSPLPTGTVTFLFSDIEGSTRLVQAFGTAYDELLERHRRALRQAFHDHGGVEVGTEGDSFFVAFPNAVEATLAAAAGQRALAAEGWPLDGEVRVRMGVHTGEGRLGGGSYVGLDVHRAARIGAAAHGGQVLVSESTCALVKGALPDGVTLRSLGEHRLKDLPAPEVLYQLVISGLPSDFPPIRSLGGQSMNLPAQLTSFVGRERERQAVRDILRSSRLVTVSGVGGTGKTRLVLEIAAEIGAEFAGGVTFVPLETLRDPDLVPIEILRALRIDTVATRPPLDRVIDFYRDRTALLVLDNLEHLPSVGSLVRSLLEAAPGLRMLVASQAVLHLPGEQEYVLAPLAAPDPLRAGSLDLEALRSNPAVMLFVERARAVRPGFDLDASNAAAIAAICTRLDGLPLAIELAAAQVKLFGPAAILQRLAGTLDGLASGRTDLPERQRTLRAAVGWSYELLPESEQRLFRGLSVFVGGARYSEIEAFAAGLSGGELTIPDPLSALTGLVDRSLVHVEYGEAAEGRFVMLETIRSFGLELLRAHGEDAAAMSTHAQLFADLAASAEPELYRADRRQWLDRLAEESGNNRAALDRLEADGDLEAALGMVASLWRFWQQRGHLVEANARVSRLLAAAEHAQPPISPFVMSRAEEAAGSIGYWARSSVGAAEIEGHYERAVEYARASGDPGREAWAMYNLAFVYDFLPSAGIGSKDAERASELREEALRRFRELGDRRGVAESLVAMGGSRARMEQDIDGARGRLAEASALLDEAGDGWGQAWVFMSLALLDSESGQLDVSRDSLLRAGEIFLRDGDVGGQILAVGTLATLAALAGDDLLSVRLSSASDTAAREMSVDVPPLPPILVPREAAMARLSPEDLQRERAAGAKLSVASILRDEIEAAHRGGPPGPGA